MGRCCPAKSNALENLFMSHSTSDSSAVADTASNASFTNLGLPENMLITLAREGLVEPTPIQAMSIPVLLEGNDLIGLAQTGTGKTAAFLLPLMTQLGYSAAVRAGQPPKALILAPTRELANQISQNVQKLAADLNLRHIAVFGGARYDAQIRGLRRGVDIVVATPGRLQDLMERGAFDPSGITHFVLDEADHMLDLGFYPAIKRIAASLPPVRQTMLFSATMPPEIEALGQQFLKDPVRVKAPQTGITADKVTQRVTLMAEGEKRDRLCDILNEETTGQTLIFVRTKRRADALAKFMAVRGFAVDALHGDMRQTLRQKVLRNFRGGDLQALIATDVAARGIDVAALSHVVNFDLTDTPEAYVHRIGRTGRAGLGGVAISFCAPDERHRLSAIISTVGGRIELFESDGTPLPLGDFKSGAAPSRQRRRPARTGGRAAGPARGRAERSGDSRQKSDRPRRDHSDARGAGARRTDTGRPDTRRPDARQEDSRRGDSRRGESWQANSGEQRPRKPFREQRDNAKNDNSFGRNDSGAFRKPRRDENRNDSFASDQPRHQARKSKGGKPAPNAGAARPARPAAKAAPSAKQLFGKRPQFNSRPNFDNASAGKPKRDAADRPAGNKPRGGKSASGLGFSGKPAKPQNHRAASKPDRAGSGARPARSNRPAQGGQGRLKRRS
jgi:ATP-dependent RNA helicase RhlE